MKVTRPLLRYFGGKWQLRHWILAHMPEHLFYAEPFAGAASVLLAKEPASGGEIINDLNQDVINLFRVMQDKGQSEELQRRLDWTPYSSAELERALQPTSDEIGRAWSMVVRSFMGIETAGMRGKAKTGFRMGNVDLGRQDQEGKRTFRNCAIDWCNWKDALGAIRERLSRVMIYEKDALEFISLMDSPDCLLYIDPTYHHAGRAANRYAVEFVDHSGLAALLLTAKSKILLSGYPNTDYCVLEKAGWTRVEKDYRANMSLERRTECLWISPNAVPSPGLQLA